MKTTEQIITELNRIQLIDKVASADHPAVKQAISFYEKYPRYQELEANGVYFVLGSIRTKKKPVKVYQYSNGSFLFVGDIITAVNAPIAGIGEGMTMPPGFDFNKIEKSSDGILKFIEEITWNF